MKDTNTYTIEKQVSDIVVTRHIFPYCTIRFSVFGKAVVFASKIAINEEEKENIATDASVFVKSNYKGTFFG